ncbi:hypothetical protein OJ996_21935 [Luteolibacter sp. GHJ8]|uniref:Glycosyl-4,4'-diaponeurosporenoate acyltransferase n=1 Tax=Luteolibacter rhizosphaerae TaxID=2989719 RepID=A0ABT3G8T4_9BACT|nr:hypothetical protein [Luteolibacter rhizosphaerae]MCW1916266.1 hypothetical protein [Luteolibacter rhizosphaerae]
MLLELPVLWVIALNSAGIPVLQMGLAWLFTHLPAGWFERPLQSPAPARRRRYESLLLVKRWKDLLPDGGSWFRSGYAKSRLHSRQSGDLRRFVTETRRGEVCHWLALAFTPLFFLWNPPWACIVITVAMLALNLPCIIIQRYNRLRFSGALAKRGSQQRTG